MDNSADKFDVILRSGVREVKGDCFIVTVRWED